MKFVIPYLFILLISVLVLIYLWFYLVISIPRTGILNDFIELEDVVAFEGGF